MLIIYIYFTTSETAIIRRPGSEKLVLMDSLCTYYYKIIEDPTMVNKNYFGFFGPKASFYLGK